MQAGDEFCEVDGVGADIAHAASGSADRGIDAPGGLLLAGVFQHRSQPALRILDDDFAYVAQLTLLDHLAGLTDHRIAGVIVSDAVELAGRLNDSRQFLRLREIEGRWLV